MTAEQVCTFRTAPRTVHIIRSRFDRVERYVVAWCGRKGLAYEPTISSYLTCRRCERARDQEAS